MCPVKLVVPLRHQVFVLQESSSWSTEPEMYASIRIQLIEEN